MNKNSATSETLFSTVSQSESDRILWLVSELFPQEVLTAMFTSRKCDHFFAELGKMDLPGRYESAPLHIAAWAGYEAIFHTPYRGTWEEDMGEEE